VAAGAGELVALAASRKLRWRETIREGLESAPQALVELLHGGNFGKMLVKVI
jgi:NADPH-dependent curcumin reductase CurA